MRSTGAISSAQLRDLETDMRAELARIERSIAHEAEAEQQALLSDTASRKVTSGMGSDGGLTATLTGRVHARRAELAEALRRMEDGRYGVCERCGESIAYGRLLAVPEATNCLECR